MLLREAGIRLIAQHGYEAVSLRMLAKEIGIQAGSLYNYISNKQQFLFDLLASIIRDLVEEMTQELQGLTDPSERLRVFIRRHIDFHTRRKEEVFIGNMELRSLTPENSKVIRQMRDEYEEILRTIIKDGLQAGQFHCSDPAVVKLAIITMLTAIASWYRPEGRRKIDTLTAEYTTLIFLMLRAEGAEANSLAAE
ncbi:MAG: TetR/AcrR family transcriptional regulator [Hyphomicrobiales bacterium]|nr:MAG: TetR/AcrR family transcriptional regulator [Hyphomicrobiales bacterium]